MKLELEADRKGIGQEPLGQQGGGKAADHRREDQLGLFGQAMFPDHCPGPFVVGPGTQHELDFIVGRQQVEIGHIHFFGHAAVRAFEVEDLHHRTRHPFDAETAVGFEQHGAARGEQSLHERVDLFLEQGLTAGDLDEGVGVSRRLGQQGAERGDCGRFLVGVFGVAVGATEVAAGEAEEKAGVARKGRLPLDAVENLGELQGGLIPHGRSRNSSPFRRP